MAPIAANFSTVSTIIGDHFGRQVKAGCFFPLSFQLVTKIHDVVLAHHIALGGPQAWKDRPERPGFTFFQAPGETNLIQLGARVNLGAAPAAGRGPGPGRGTGVAPIEGQEGR